MVTISSRAATRSAMPKEEVWLIIAVALAMVPLIGKFLGWWWRSMTERERGEGLMQTLTYHSHQPPAHSD